MSYNDIEEIATASHQQLSQTGGIDAKLTI